MWIFGDRYDRYDIQLASRILKIEKSLKHASSFDEFKTFCLEGCYDE